MSPRYRSLVRRMLAIVLMVTLVARVTPAPLAPSTVHAATSDCGDWSGQIVQDCALGANFQGAVEQPVIDTILQTYNLPSSDAGRLLSWQRNMVRAATFNELVNIINTPAYLRSVDEQTAVNDLASLVELQRWEAA